MRRINIVKDNKITTITFREKSDLIDYIFFNIQVKQESGTPDASKSKEIANLVWNLGYAKELITEWGYKFRVFAKGVA